MRYAWWFLAARNQPSIAVSVCFRPRLARSVPSAESIAKQAGESTKRWLSFMLMYNYVIPISLYVTLELQKLAGSLLINWDLEVRVGRWLAVGSPHRARLLRQQRRCSTCPEF